MDTHGPQCKIAQTTHPDRSAANLCVLFDVAITSAHIWIACSSPILCYQVPRLYKHNLNHATLSIGPILRNVLQKTNIYLQCSKQAKFHLKNIKCASLQNLVSLIHYV